MSALAIKVVEPQRRPSGGQITPSQLIYELTLHIMSFAFICIETTSTRLFCHRSLPLPTRNAKTTQRMFYCSDHAREIDKKLLGIFQLRGFRNQLHVKIKQ